LIIVLIQLLLYLDHYFIWILCLFVTESS